MPEKAMRDADGVPLFVRDDGSYAEEFPPENVVRHATGEDTAFIVFGFAGERGDYEEYATDFEEEDDALDFATDIYGQTKPDLFDKDSEVYEVEVHEVDEWEAEEYVN